MNIFHIPLIIIFLFTLTSCASVKKEPIEKEQPKVEEVKEEEEKSIYTLYLDAEKIVKKTQQDKFAEAREKIMYVINNVNPENIIFDLTDAYHLLGLLNIKEKRYNEAIDAFQKVLEKDPDQIKALNAIGLSYTELKKFEEAEESFKKIIVIEPINFSAHMNLGNVLYKKGAYENAINYFLRAASFKTDDQRPYFNIAEIYYELKKYDQAEKFYKKAIETDKSGALRAKSNLSHLLLKNNRTKEALTLLEKREGLPPSYSNYYINLAVAQRTEGKLEQAEKNYLKALELDPRSTSALLNLGILYDVYWGKRERALTYYKKYIELGGQDKETVEKWIKVIKGSGAKREQ